MENLFALFALHTFALSLSTRDFQVIYAYFWLAFLDFVVLTVNLEISSQIVQFTFPKTPSDFQLSDIYLQIALATI